MNGTCSPARTVKSAIVRKSSPRNRTGVVNRIRFGPPIAVNPFSGCRTHGMNEPWSNRMANSMCIRTWPPDRWNDPAGEHPFGLTAGHFVAKLELTAACQVARANRSTRLQRLVALVDPIVVGGVDKAQGQDRHLVVHGYKVCANPCIF